MYQDSGLCEMCGLTTEVVWPNESGLPLCGACHCAESNDEDWTPPLAVRKGCTNLTSGF